MSLMRCSLGQKVREEPLLQVSALSQKLCPNGHTNMFLTTENKDTKVVAETNVSQPVDTMAIIQDLTKRIEALEKTGGTETSKVVNNAFVFQKDFGIFNGKNIVLGKTVGTKIGTASDQKLAFYGKTPIVPQSTSGTAGGFAAGSGAAAKQDSQWDGGSGYSYGVADLVKILKDYGLLHA